MRTRFRTEIGDAPADVIPVDIAAYARFERTTDPQMAARVTKRVDMIGRALPATGPNAAPEEPRRLLVRTLIELSRNPEW